MYRSHAVTALFFSVLTPLAAAQTAPAALHGTVTDSSGALVSNATISVQPVGNEAVFSAKTGRDGEFTVPALAAGSYLVTADQLGFNKVFKTVKLTAGETAEVDLMLSVNALNQNVTVTAQTAAFTEAPTAQTITSVDREDTKDSADFTIQESLDLVPGVTTITGNGPRDISISVRGSNDRQAYGIRNVQLFEDGFPVTQPDGLGRADLTDPHAYDSIDVVQGPSSTLYGNYATGGAVFFHTRPGGAVHGIDLGADVGSFGFLNNYVTVGGAQDAYEYSVFVSNTRAKQYIDHFSFDTVTANLFAKFTPRRQDRFTLKFIDNDLDTQLPIRLSLNQYNVNPYQSGCANYATGVTPASQNCATVSLFVNGSTGARIAESADEAGLGRRDRRTVVGARWEHDLTDQTTWRTQLVWDVKDINQPTGSTSAKGASPSFNLVSDGTRKGRLFGFQSTTYGGGFYKYEGLNSYSYNVMPGGNATLGALTSDYFGQLNAGGFRGREELALGERMTVIGGFAGEYTNLAVNETLFTYSATASPAVTAVPANRTFFNYAPEAAVLLRASGTLRLHARLGTGYGTPQASQLLITPQGTYGNNTSLQAQKNVGIDLGADWLIARNIQLSATAFYERFSNELVSTTASAQAVGASTFNAPSSAHRGLVAGLDWRPISSLVNGLRFRAAYQLDTQVYRSYTEVLSGIAFVRDGNRIPGVVPNSLNARLIYDQASSRYGNFGAYLETNFRDAYWFDNANLLKAPSAMLINFDVHFDPAPGHGLWSRSHFYFDLQNVANRTYVGSAGNITDTTSATAATIAATTGSIYAGSPRSSIGGFRIKF
jgi:iron complex outermembrane receptor protein